MNEVNNVYLYYRTYPGWSGKNIFAKNKFDLINACWKSLEIENTLVNSCAWIDNPNEAFKDFMSRKIKDHHYTYEGFDCNDSKNRLPLFGGSGSYFKLREFMSNNNHKDDDIILILEDDYLFVSGGFKKWIEACRHFNGFVSPIDHPNTYRRNDHLFAKKSKIEAFNGHHWRKIESTIGTVGGKYQYFKKTYFVSKMPRFYVYSFWPGRLLGKELASIDRVFYRRIHYFLGIDLYVPIPGIAAHLSKNELDPVVDWGKRYHELAENV